MKALIGDIGNTITKICLIDVKNFRINKIFYFSSKYINSSVFLKKMFKKILKKNNISKML